MFPHLPDCLRRLRQSIRGRARDAGGWEPKLLRPPVASSFALGIFFIIYHGFNLVVFRGSSALRSFRLSPVIFTTMASADSRLALTKRASPGKVHELSDPNRRILPGTSFRC